ncbi:cobalamin biosynthesis protein [Sphingobium sp. AR-3-1]|uniref:Cobalamin biosynthesis protein n=1 Tax=Sphingobium psychrophilum TaxID=2728834 RepID=A0A7X9ZSH4_9SPHN|nr:cobalamin biosynthesis protein [Sphingobium psychrophilum]NML10597.1 cobalamin biosynthesis protein [Sphingobium psychrophilum]
MIVAGFGCRTGASLDTLRIAFDFARRGLPPVTHLATLDDKVEALAPLAAALGLPLLGLSPDALAAVTTPTRSPASLKARGVGSVAEACALAAAGARARLLRTRHISPDRMATCAIAQGLIP